MKSEYELVCPQFLTHNFFLVHIDAELGPGLHVGPELGLEHVPDRLVARDYRPRHGEAHPGERSTQAPEVLHSVTLSITSYNAAN